MKEIYKITNLINNKIYIGQHNGKRKGRYFGSGKILKFAINKYGKENFIKEIIEEGDFTQKEIDELEQKYIKLYNSTNSKIGYNINLGGGGHSGMHLSEETKRKISAATKGRKRISPSVETRRKISLAKIGQVIPLESRLRGAIKISEKLKGRKLSKEHIEALVRSHLGCIIPEEQRLKMIASNINNPKKSKKIECYTKDNVFVAEYPSIAEAARQLKVSGGNICSCLLGIFKTSAGFTWKYKEINQEIMK